VFQPHQRNYLGNKRQLLKSLEPLMNERLGKYGVLWDAFAGTGSVAYHFATRHRRIILTDTLKSCVIPLKTFFNPRDDVYLANASGFIKQINSILDYEPSLGQYAQEWWGGKYFSMGDAKRIDNAREWIDDRFVNDNREWFKDYCITSLSFAVDKVAQTYGHYDAFKDEAKWAKKKPLTLAEPDLHKVMHPSNRVLHGSANVYATLMHASVCADVAFFDPPYNERDYGTNYHLLENLVTWEKYPCRGKTAKCHTDKSDYTRRKKVGDAFRELVAATPAKYIVMTYNNQPGNLLTDYEITSAFEKRGKLEIIKFDHKLITTGLATTDITDNQERVFICEVKS
jgi:adenine-specific DNA-methyltransferase